MRSRRHWIVALIGALLVSACTQNQSSSSSSSSSPTAAGAATPSHTALPASAKTPVTFGFTDVEVATGGSNTLKMTFTIANGSKDPQLCDPSEFSVQLSDGTVIDADGSADNSCSPDTVDPNGSGTATMYFDLPSAYTGVVTMFMVTNDTVVGQGTTTLK
jgi:hypothetical protein